MSVCTSTTHLGVKSIKLLLGVIESETHRINSLVGRRHVYLGTDARKHFAAHFRSTAKLRS